MAVVQVKDRIKELRRVRASELIPNPKNWRRHPVHQADALRGVLSEIGYADALIARETPDGLMLIDGHLRAEISSDEMVPVLVLDVTEAEADKLLATLDPLASMAVLDSDAFAKLVESVTTDSDALAGMFDSIKEGGYDALTPMMTPTVPADEWDGMPGFAQDDRTSWKRLIVHFANHDDMQAFGDLIGQSLTDKTVSLWFPEVERTSYVDKRYVDES